MNPSILFISKLNMNSIEYHTNSYILLIVLYIIQYISNLFSFLEEGKDKVSRIAIFLFFEKLCRGIVFVDSK